MHPTFLFTLFTLSFFSIFFFTLPTAIHSLNQDGLYLQRLTQSLDDPAGFFSGWNARDDTPCNWTGVKCGGPTPGAVTSLNFTNASIGGPFPLILCRLRSLTFLSLNNNSINSTLPSDIATCSNLRHLDLASNLLVGEIPESLADIPNLTYLDLGYNNFTGEVPDSFGRFRNLEAISLMDNLLDGKFPNMLTNVSTLKEFNVTNNPFTPSQLGDGLGKMANLEYFWAQNCNVIGKIPDLSGMKSIITFDVSSNQLTGKIPSSLTELTTLFQIELFSNKLSGELPKTGWAKMKSLRNFDASMNQLTGTIPNELAQLPLASFNIYENELEGVIPASVADSPNLYELKLFSNRLTGELPRKLGENSELNLVDVSDNHLSGGLPPNLCKNGVLEQLLLINASLSGEIPASYSECRSLLRVRLSNNHFSGEVPAGFWGLPNVVLLELSGNSFSGGVSKSIASAFDLAGLLISKNNFSGEIPAGVGLLRKMVSFIASNNKFSGPLPESIVNLVNLSGLDLHDNQLSGEIPTGIKNLAQLNNLNLADNQFTGEIPAEIGDLSLNYVDLSNNQLSGRIPDQLQNLKLNQFNLSNNHFSGEIPPFYAKEIYKSSFLGNPGLCGDISGLCDTKASTRKDGYFWVLRAIFILAAVIFVLGVVWFYWKYKNFKQAKRSIDRSKWTLMSFHKLGFSEYEILDCLDEDNVIGSGASGKVYKAVLSNGEAVAVKKLWGSSNKVMDGGAKDVEKGLGFEQDDGFEAEVDTLGKIRHKNIVRLWCCCKTKDCKLLVYEYMVNGSLGDLLHGPKSGLLDWPTRYRIALDAAEGLSYLHHDCVPSIVHRDVKSNNILLDANFGAKVADFGVAKVVDAIGKGTKSMSVIAGSCGYIAPEYAYTLRVNEKSDIYSFGVVILELVTGKRPVDPEYGEKDLVKWVCTTIDQKGVDHVLDPKLDSCFKEEISKVLNIGLSCTSPLPINRPSMRRVVKVLLEVSGENHSRSGVKDGKLTPYYYEDASDQGSVV